MPVHVKSNLIPNINLRERFTEYRAVEERNWMDFCSSYHFIFDRKIRVALSENVHVCWLQYTPQPNVTGRQNPTCRVNTG